MWKLSPSQLEGYRAFKIDLYGKTREEYLEELQGKRVTTPAMAQGTAIHKYLEDPMAPREIELHPEEIQQLAEIRLLIPVGLSEVYTKYEMTDEIYFNMYVDRLVGREVHEIKTGSRFYGIESYESSLQWKLYLLGTGARTCTYHVITYTEKEPRRFTYHKPFRFYAYNEMTREVHSMALEFIDFCKHWGVTEAITPKERR